MRNLFFLLLMITSSIQAYSPELTQNVQVILDNYVQVYSPKEEKDAFFTVGQVLQAFLSELKKKQLFPKVSLLGSTVLNQCVAPIDIQCNDIDIEIVFSVEKEKENDLLFQVNTAFLSALNRLLETKFSFAQEAEDFHVGIEFSEFVSYKIKGASGYTPYSPVYITGTSNYIPLSLSIHPQDPDGETSVLDSLRTIGNTMSFFIDLKLFEDQLGTLGPNLYILSSAEEANAQKAIDTVKKRIFTCKNPECKNGQKWLRFLKNITEGFSDPSLTSNQAFASSFIKNKQTVNDLKQFFAKKRTIPNYYLYSLVNATFHMPDIDLQHAFLKDLHKSFKEENPCFTKAPWMNFISILCRNCPESHIPTLLKLLIPFFAIEVIHKRHLEKMQLQCQFLQDEKKLYLMIPHLDSSDEPYLSEILSILFHPNISFN